MSDKGVQALDWMLEDYSAEQRAQDKIPNVTDAKAYLVPILEKIERKPKPAPSTPLKQEQQGIDEKVQQRAREMGWHIDRRSYNVPKPAQRKLTKIEQQLRRRIRLLASKPDWAARLKQLNPLALNGTLGEEKRRQAAAYSMKVIEDSCAVFGDWRKEKPKKLYSK